MSRERVATRGQGFEDAPEIGDILSADERRIIKNSHSDKENSFIVSESDKKIGLERLLDRITE